jgi:hypothetical protein
LKKYGFVPDKLVTNELRSYAAAASHLGIAKRHERGRWRNNRAENSHQANPTKGEEDARVQERRVGAKISLSPRSHLQHFQHLQCPTRSDISKNAPSLQGIGHAGVARSRRRRMMSAVKPDEPASNFQQRDNAVAGAGCDVRLHYGRDSNSCLFHPRTLGFAPRRGVLIVKMFPEHFWTRSSWHRSGVAGRNAGTFVPPANQEIACGLRYH